MSDEVHAFFSVLGSLFILFSIPVAAFALVHIAWSLHALMKLLLLIVEHSMRGVSLRVERVVVRAHDAEREDAGDGA